MNPSKLLLATALALVALPDALPAQWTARDSLTLAAAQAAALAGNPMLAAARSRVEAVGAVERSAALLPDPELQLGVMNASLPGLRTDMPNSMAPSIQLMQMIPTAGKLRSAGRIAARETDLAGAEAAEAAWMVRERVGMEFYDLYAAEREIDVMRETARLLASYEAVARSMYGAGTGRQADVLRAGVEVRRMDAEIARMEAMRAAAAARLNALLGRAADTPVPPVALPLLPVALPAADTLRAWAAASRPLLRRGRIAADQAAERTRLARRELWPDLTVGVQYGQRDGGEMGTERMGSLMVGLTLPVYAHRRQLAMREEAAAMERMAGAERADAETGVDARISELLADLERSRSLLRMYRGDVLPLADAAVESALSGYRVGAVDFMTLVDARMEVNRYRQELVRLTADYGSAVARLEATVGRELTRGTPTPEDDR